MSKAHLKKTMIIKLNDGKVLVVGGNMFFNAVRNNAELYDPSTGTWTLTGNINIARFQHTASVLANGKVLIIGGYNSSATVLNTVELYDPSIGAWILTDNINIARHQHQASVLTNGKVLITGGKNASVVLNSAELY